MLNELIKDQAEINPENGFSIKQMQKIMKKFGKKKIMKF
jgi:hypothetical protein